MQNFIQKFEADFKFSVPKSEGAYAGGARETVRAGAKSLVHKIYVAMSGTHRGAAFELLETAQGNPEKAMCLQLETENF